MTEGHADQDVLVALALQALDAHGRAPLIAHLAECGQCRGEYTSIEDGVLRALAAAPSIAPPAGFSGRVLAAMGMDEATAASEWQASPPARGQVAVQRWRTPLVAAAAALMVGVALGVGGMLAIGALTPPPPVSSVPGEVTSASALVTKSGETVGSVGVVILAGREHLVITVTRARPGASYDCMIVGEDDQRRSAGTWTLDARYGGEEASGTWVVELPEGGVEHVELVAPSGTVWSRAEF